MYVKFWGAPLPVYITTFGLTFKVLGFLAVHSARECDLICRRLGLRHARLRLALDTRQPVTLNPLCAHSGTSRLAFARRRPLPLCCGRIRCPFSATYDRELPMWSQRCY